MSLTVIDPNLVADQVTEGDLIVISYGDNNDTVEVTSFDPNYDENRVEIIGYSYEDGDLVEYIVPFDHPVKLLGFSI